MAGFNWNQFYTIFMTKMATAYPSCTIGRYTTPKETEFPYLDVALGDIPGGNYDLQGIEGSVKPLIVLSVYSNDAAADSTCEAISRKAKEIMLSYGFQCKFGATKMPNADSSIARWVGRYQRVFGAGDELNELEK